MYLMVNLYLEYVATSQNVGAGELKTNKPVRKIA